MKALLRELGVVAVAFLAFGACDSGGGEDEPVTCEAQATRCDGGDVVTCSAAGSAWELLEACDAGCSDGECIIGDCEPDCSGKVCGDDACGGSCGSCGAGEDCQDGQCVGDAPGGTWTDPDSGLTWMDPPVQMAPGSDKSWSVATEACADLDLAGHTDWRLPSIDELRALIRGCPGTMPGGACAAGEACHSPECFGEPGACRDGCDASQGPVDAGAGMGCYWPEAFGMKASCFLYWSSTLVPTIETDTDYAATVNFDDATVDYFSDTGNLDIRCVRN